MKCRKGFEIKPMKSAAGWYMGTKNLEGYPNCRISRNYADTEAEALKLPLDRQTGCIENEFCNNGKGCFNV